MSVCAGGGEGYYFIAVMSRFIVIKEHFPTRNSIVSLPHPQHWIHPTEAQFKVNKAPSPVFLLCVSVLFNTDKIIVLQCYVLLMNNNFLIVTSLKLSSVFSPLHDFVIHLRRKTLSNGIKLLLYLEIFILCCYTFNTWKIFDILLFFLY